MTTILLSPVSHKKKLSHYNDEQYLKEALGYVPDICKNGEFKDSRDFIAKTRPSLRQYPSYCSRDYREAQYQLEQLKGEYQAVSFVFDYEANTHYYLFRDNNGNTSVRIKEGGNKSNIGLLKF